MSIKHNILKSFFLLFFSLSNTGSVFFIIPILCEYLIKINILPNWYYLGIVLSIYELGKLFGNFLWIFLNKKFTSSLLVMISLILLSILNLSLLFINSYSGLIIYRFLLGLSNNLSIMSNNIYLELSLKKNFGFVLYIIKGLSTIISIFIPVFSFKFSKYKMNLNNISSIFLSIINLITIFIIIIMIKIKLLKIKSNKKLVQMNIFVNELDNSMKQSKKNNSNFEVSKNNNSNVKRNNMSMKMNSNIETNPSSAERKIMNQDKKINRFDTSKEVDSTNNFQNIIKRDPIDLMIKNEQNKRNFNNINYFDSSLQNQSNIFKIINKELKFSYILIFLNLNDSIIFIWFLIFLYIDLYWNCFKFALFFSLYNLCFSILNYPFTRKLINKSNQSNKKQISSQMKYYLLTLIVITFLEGVIISIYYLISSKNIFRNIIFISLIILNLSKNLINSLCIQIFQIYIAIEFNIYSENMRKLQQFKHFFNSFFKTIFDFISSFAYYFLYRSQNFKDFDLKTSIFQNCYFILFPEIIIIIIIILKKISIEE